MNPATLQAFVGDAGASLVPVPRSERLTPDEASFEQLGALVCDWTNDPEPRYWTGAPEGTQTVRVRVLPEGLEQAAAYVEAYQIADPTYGEHVQGPRCTVQGASTGHCEVMGALGDTWAEFIVSGIVLTPGATEAALRDAFRADLADPFVAAVQSAAVGPRWAPPTTGGAEACEAVLSTEQVAALTGMPEVWFGEFWDGPRIGQYSYVTTETGGRRCSIHPTGGDNTFGAVFLLPGGEWAFERYRTSWVDAGGVVQQIPGLADDAAVFRCGVEAAECRLDFTVGTDWVAVAFPPVPDGEVAWVPDADYSAARASVLSLGEAIVANLSAAGDA